LGMFLVQLRIARVKQARHMQHFAPVALCDRVSVRELVCVSD